MKNQNYGSVEDAGNVANWPADLDELSRAHANYKEKRLNGDEKQDGPIRDLPYDGMGRWAKGEEKSDGYVWGVEESDGEYHYEYRYDSGNGDKKWMEECDRNYLARLHLDGAKTEQERQDLAENRDRAARSAEEVTKLPTEQLSAWLKSFAQKENERKEGEAKEKAAKEQQARIVEQKAREEKEQAEKKRLAQEKQEREAKEEQARKQPFIELSQRIQVLTRQVTANTVTTIDLTDLKIPANLSAEIKTADIKLRPITAKDLKELLQELKRNTSVTSLCLANNKGITDDIISSLVDLYVIGFFSSRTSPNTTLTAIDLRGTSVTLNGVYKLEQAISKQNLKVNITCDFKTKATIEAEKKLEESQKKLEAEQKKKEDKEREEKARQAALQKAQAEKDRKEQEAKKGQEKAEKEKINSGLMQQLLVEVNEQRVLIDRLQNGRTETLLDAKVLDEKRTELKEILASIPSATGEGLRLLQTNATELKQVIDRQIEFQNDTAEIKMIEGNDALNDYYYTMLILLTDCICACKTIHTKAGPAQTANSKMDLDDYVVAGIKALGAQVPGVSAITGALTAGEQFLSSRSKLQKINKIVRFFPTTSDCDNFAKCLARKLTLAQETALKALPTQQVGIIRRAISAGKDIKCWITADDINNPIRRLAKDHCEACLKLIIDEQCKAPASSTQIPQIIVAILGGNQQQQNLTATLTAPISSTTQPATSFATTTAAYSIAPNPATIFAANSSASAQTLTASATSSAPVASVDAQALSLKLAELMSEQERIKKTMAANEKLANEAALEAKGAAQKADKATKAVASLTTDGGNTAQMFALAKDQPKGLEINVEGLAKENAELRTRQQYLETTVAQLIEALNSHHATSYTAKS